MIGTIGLQVVCYTITTLICIHVGFRNVAGAVFGPAALVLSAPVFCNYVYDLGKVAQKVKAIIIALTYWMVETPNGPEDAFPIVAWNGADIYPESHSCPSSPGSPPGDTSPPLDNNPRSHKHQAGNGPSGKCKDPVVIFGALPHSLPADVSLIPCLCKSLPNKPPIPTDYTYGLYIHPTLVNVIYRCVAWTICYDGRNYTV
jgi:hypothetical protein